MRSEVLTRCLSLSTSVAGLVAGLGCSAGRGGPEPATLEIPALVASRSEATPKRPEREGPKGPAMVDIPGATFLMGSDEGDPNESPPHRVTVAPFRLDTTEVTAGQYLECVEAGACPPTGTDQLCTGAAESPRPGHPVNCVSWHDARAFCDWAGKRLATEEEWELAARGPRGRRYPWGEDYDPSLVCIDRGNEGGPCVAGEHARGGTPEGVLDLTGNLWEWTESKHCPYPEKRCDTESRVNRGGCWQGNLPKHVRGAIRYGDDPATRDIYIGFRCAK